MADFTLTFQTLAIAITGGLLPALVWLWFWHRQDAGCPEPKGLVLLSFLGGMIIVFFVLPVQQLINAAITPLTAMLNSIGALVDFSALSEDTSRVLLLSFVEEFAKYLVVFFIAFNSQYFDEPIDAVIYILTVALGFAAIENALYILKDLSNGETINAFLNGNLRLLGATLVHTVASAAIGIALAIVFYMPRFVKFISISIGIICATLLHAYFNLTIIDVQGTIGTLAVFSRFWIAMIIVIICIKIINRISNRNQTCAI